MVKIGHFHKFLISINSNEGMNLLEEKCIMLIQLFRLQNCFYFILNDKKATFVNEIFFLNKFLFSPLKCNDDQPNIALDQG